MICSREDGEKKGKGGGEGGGGVDGEDREEGKGSIVGKRRGLTGVRWFKPGLKAVMSSSSRGSHLYVTC